MVFDHDKLMRKLASEAFNGESLDNFLSRKRLPRTTTPSPRPKLSWDRIVELRDNKGLAFEEIGDKIEEETGRRYTHSTIYTSYFKAKRVDK